MKNDNSKLVVAVIIIMCLVIIGGAAWFVIKPTFKTRDTAAGPTSASPAPDSTPAINETDVTYKDWQAFVYAPTKTTILAAPGWKSESLSQASVGEVYSVREPQAGEVFIVTFSERSLVAQNTVVEVRELALNSGKTVSLLLTRSPNVAPDRASEIVLTTKKFAVGEQIPAAPVEGIGSKPVYVTVNYISPGARTNPGRPLGEFSGDRFEQVIQSLKTLKSPINV